MYSVDSTGRGTGKIVSADGSFYEGEFVDWKRHGHGVQMWSGGEEFRGTWENDNQLEGVYFDANGVQWKGNFVTMVRSQTQTTLSANSLHPVYSSKQNLVQLEGPERVPRDSQKLAVKPKVKHRKSSRTPRGKPITQTMTTIQTLQPETKAKYKKTATRLVAQQIYKGSRFSTRQTERSPGPGDYSADTAFGKQGVAVSIGTGQRGDFLPLLNTPGPTYHPDSNSGSNNSVSIAPPPLMEKVRVKHAPQPGPGSYAVPMVDRKGLAITDTQGRTMVSVYLTISGFP
jgi:hypothetical protein